MRCRTTTSTSSRSNRNAAATGSANDATTCSSPVYELGRLADILGFNGRTPSLCEELAVISAACQRFTAAGRYGHAYAQDPEFVLAQRSVLKEALTAIFKEISDMVIPGTGDWASDA